MRRFHHRQVWHYGCSVRFRALSFPDRAVLAWAAQGEMTMCRASGLVILGVTMGLISMWAQSNGNRGEVTSAMAGSFVSPPVYGSLDAGVQPYLSGYVLMDDGSPLPGSVDIRVVCGNTFDRIMAHASPDGGFGFQWNSIVATFGDSSQASSANIGGAGAYSLIQAGTRDIYSAADCELKARWPGYKSDTAALYGLTGQSSLDVGPIVLHRVTAGEAAVVSVLSLGAPKSARRSFINGLSLARAQRLADATASFEKALAIYPEYVDAWLNLGKVQRQTGQKEAAHASFLHAANLDGKLARPWQELGYLAVDESKWEDAVYYLDQAVRLDPHDSPITWYFSAVADYYSGRFDQAERSVRAEMKLDATGNPRMYYLLGLVLIARHDLEGAASALRTYIASSPKPTDVTFATQQLNRVEKQTGR